VSHPSCGRASCRGGRRAGRADLGVGLCPLHHALGYSVEGAIASTFAAPQTADPLSAIRRDVEAWLAGQAPGQAWDGQLGSWSIKPESLELLPSSLPIYRSVEAYSRWRTEADTLTGEDV